MSVLHVYTLACDGADGACEATLATVENRAEHARTVIARRRIAEGSRGHDATDGLVARRPGRPADRYGG